jgi:hypothetical protein
MRRGGGARARAARGPRWCTRTSSAPTRTRSRTTSASTRRRRCARRRRSRPAHPRARCCGRSTGWRPRRSSSASRPRSRGGQRRGRRGAGVAAAGPVDRDALPLLAGRRPHGRAVRHRGRPALPGQRDHDGGPHQRDPEGRDAARPAHRRLRRGRGGRSREELLDEVKGKGGVFKVTPGCSASSARPRLQLAARRGEHRRARDRDGGARAEAGGRDPVLRLHLAGDDADPRRAGDHALPLERTLELRRW